ncbi:hypothetical protein CMI37_14825 [Candidatus Pacearchaeota archaeon]|nr:hypothetical protein [Candidatus Pacearchaeota archaeon]
MKIVDIADEVYRELAAPTSLSIPAVAYWLRSNIGALNNYINTSYVINATTFEIEQTDRSDVTSEISEEAKAILKKMYMVHHYDKEIRTNIGAASTDTVIEVSDAGSRVRKINKNEVMKTLANIKKQEHDELQRLIAAFKIKGSAPRQVTGDDTVEGNYNKDRTDVTYNRSKSNY